MVEAILETGHRGREISTLAERSGQAPRPQRSQVTTLRQGPEPLQIDNRAGRHAGAEPFPDGKQTPAQP